MGMYCCCSCKIMKDWETRCTCDWEGWISIHDWPPPRKNKQLPFGLPIEDKEYMTRYQNNSGDHYEKIQFYYSTERQIECGYTGNLFWVHWSGDDEEQPYAWREIREEDRND